MNTLPTLYLNENIAIRVGLLLEQKGIRSIHTRDANNGGIDDESQLRFAASRGWILVTHNRWDFRKLHEQWSQAGRKHAGIIVLGCGELEIVAERVAIFLKKHFELLPPGFCESPPPLSHIQP